MIATEAEMVSAKLPLAERDYCAHTKIEYLRCIANVFPWNYKCAHEKHAQGTCLYEEYDPSVTTNPNLFEFNLNLFVFFLFVSVCSYLLRMKEYERERRLMVRRERKAKKQQFEEMVA